MKSKLIYTGIIIIALATSCGEKQDKITSQIPVVETIFPEQGNVQTTITASGSVSNSEEIMLSFKTGGIVETVFVEEGDYIENGYLLAKLNTTELDAQIEQVKLNIEKYRRDEYRLSKLVKDTIATLEQLQNVQTILAAQEQQLRGLEFNRQQAFFRAPASGIILRKQVNVGEFKAPGNPVLVIGSNDGIKGGKWTFRSSLSDKDRVSLNEGQRAIITLDVITGKEFEGTICRLSSVPDIKTGTYDCYVSFDSQNENIVYGLSGKLNIPYKSERQFTMLPLDALLGIEGHSAIIYTLDNNGIVGKQNVSIHAINNEGMASLNEQLPSTLQVIVSGKNNVTPGQKAEKK